MKGVFGGLITSFQSSTPLLNPGGLRACWGMSQDPSGGSIDPGMNISNPGGMLNPGALAAGCWGMSQDPKGGSLDPGMLFSNPVR